MSWLAFGALVVATVVLLLLPGGIVNRCARLSWGASLALAPAVSAAIIAASAVLANKVGVGWNLLPPAVLTVVCAAGCWVVRWIAHHVVDSRHVSSSTVAPEVVASHPAGPNVAHTGTAPRAARIGPDDNGDGTGDDARPVPQRAAGRRSAPGWAWWLAGAVLGAVLTGGHMVAILGRPDNFSQTYDNIFHLNAIRWILDNSNGSSLALTMTSGDGPAAFYPLAWHDIASLSLKAMHSADVVAGNNAMVLVVPALVWVLGCFYLLHALGRVTRPGLIAAGLLVSAFPSFPYFLASWGALYPNMFGMAMIPATIALSYQTLGLGSHRLRLRTALPIGVLAIFGMAISHPNTIALYCVILIPLLITWLIRVLRAPSDQRSPWQRLAAMALFLVFAAAVVVIWKYIRPPEAAAFWAPIMGKKIALWQALTLTPRSAVTTILPAAVIVALGALIVLITRRQLWLLVAHGFVIFLWVVVAALPISPFRSTLVGIWYNDASRLAAALPLTAFPLAAIACNALAEWIARLARRQWPGARAEAITSWVLTVVMVAVLFPVTQLSAPLRQAVRDGSDSYRVTLNANVVDTDEYALLKRLPGLVPAGERVATVPYNGSSMAYALENVLTTTTHILYSPSTDVAEINANLRNAESQPQVCSALRNLNVHYALDFGTFEVNNSSYAVGNPGFADLSQAPGFVPIASSGHAVLYRIDACG
ncbi:Conserved domain protein [Propionibacterium freudenreichii]|nr:Conserved domain protein [Propionibacterium freudenreichii]SCQ75495.1 Conserved domain protein [Propionibacterium freudenreichii]